MLRRASENKLFMRRLVECVDAGGVHYPYSEQERIAADILGADNVLNPALTLFGWPDAGLPKNPPIHYSRETLIQCAELNRKKEPSPEERFKPAKYYRWRLVYIHGISLSEQLERYRSNHFRQWMDSDKELRRKNKNAEWMTQSHQSGYYLINYINLECGGQDYRARQDALLANLGANFGRIPIGMLSEAAISFFYAWGEKYAELAYSSHWGDEVSANGNFVSMEIKLEGRIDERKLAIAIEDNPVGKSWAGDAFVGRHGMCLYRKHEKEPLK